jgi:hypothetical protein
MLLLHWWLLLWFLLLLMLLFLLLQPLLLLLLLLLLFLLLCCWWCWWLSRSPVYVLGVVPRDHSTTTTVVFVSGKPLCRSKCRDFRDIFVFSKPESTEVISHYFFVITHPAPPQKRYEDAKITNLRAG